MNFKAYKLWQKEYLAKNPNVFRADCMNPFKSMDYLLKDVEFTNKKRTKEELYELWRKVNNIEIPSNYEVALTRGVRHSLSLIFSMFKEREFYIPKDIYPRYFELAKENKVKTFVTYPTLDWSALKDAKESIILLTIPFTPLGREVGKNDIVEIIELQKRGNIIVIDSVYDYNLNENFKKLEPLFKGNVIFLHSLSKTYFSPEVLGMAYMPLGYKFYFENTISNYEIKEVDYGRAYDILDQVPKLPHIQAQEFIKGFDVLAENTGLDVYNSKIAYFTVIEEPFEELLKNNILGIPASVFGSDSDDLTVLTGLFYLSELDRKG